MKIELEITRTVEVEVNVSPATKGSRDEFGVPMEPDDPPEVEIVSAKWQVCDNWAKKQADMLMKRSDASDFDKRLRKLLVTALNYGLFVDLSAEEEDRVKELATECEI